MPADVDPPAETAILFKIPTFTPTQAEIWVDMVQDAFAIHDIAYERRKIKYSLSIFFNYLIMLNLRVAMHDDGQLSPAEIVYDTPLTLPADLSVPAAVHHKYNPADYADRLRDHMQQVKPVLTKNNVSNKPYSYVDSNLANIKSLRKEHE